MNIDRDKVTELLKNFRSYKYAVSNGVASFQTDDTLGMPMGGAYGSRPPRGFDARGSTLPSILDFQLYSRAVRIAEGAVNEVLDDVERDVIERKYMDRNTLTLEQIGERNKYCERQARRIHKRALTKLTLALRFVEIPEIINLDQALETMSC